MSGISSPVRVPPLLSARTASYVAALIREGDSFDYSKWLQEVKEKERGTKQVLAASTTGELVRREVRNPCDAPESEDIWPTSGPIPTTRKASIPLAIWRIRRHKAEDETSEARLARRLEQIRDAWNKFQSNRPRHAVYVYLAPVFAIIEHYKVRRKTRKLLRYAFDFAGLPFDKNADPFTAVIRCTSETVDSKTISKWARALRYVARCKPHETTVKAFMKDLGGVNACADLYTKHFGRARRG